MPHWAALVDSDQFAAESLYARESLVIPTDPTRLAAVTVGDPVLLLGPGEAPVLFGLGKVLSWYDSAVTVAYTARLLDEPLATALVIEPGLTPVSTAEYESVAVTVPPGRRTDADRSEWFVSVALPIEASSRAEAVREFWTYVDKLGPRELPAYVWPRGDELAMQAYLLGSPTNEDPEEEDPP